MGMVGLWPGIGPWNGCPNSVGWSPLVARFWSASALKYSTATSFRLPFPFGDRRAVRPQRVDRVVGHQIWVHGVDAHRSGGRADTRLTGSDHVAVLFGLAEAVIPRDGSSHCLRSAGSAPSPAMAVVTATTAITTRLEGPDQQSVHGANLLVDSIRGSTLACPRRCGVSETPTLRRTGAGKHGIEWRTMLGDRCDRFQPLRARERVCPAARFVDDIADGSCGAVISGDAGFGKTILWRASRRRGGDDRRQDPCDELRRGGDPPRVWRPRRLPRRGTRGGRRRPRRAAAPRARGRDRSGNAVGRVPDLVVLPRAFLACLRALAGRSPVLLAIDDVHRLDPPSERILAFAVRRLGDAPVGALVMRRGDAANPLGLATTSTSASSPFASAR